MNDITINRDLNTVTNEIISLRNQAQQMALTYSIEIGRRLTEAKGLVPHGEWANWLENKVEFKQRTANNFMRIYEEYGTGQISMFENAANSQPVANLNYSQLVMLLALPKDQRNDFIEDNDVENMTKRELEKAIKDKKEAVERAEAAERRIEQFENEKKTAEHYEKQAAVTEQKNKDLQTELQQAKEALDKAKANEKKAKAKLKELKENPEIPQEVIDKANAEAEARAAEKSAKELEKKTAELQDKLTSSEDAKQAAERAADEARQRAAELEKRIKMQNPNVERFKILFENVQKEVFTLTGIINKLQEDNPEIAQKLKNAMTAFLKQY